MAFSEHFLNGLATKSQGFQDAFFETMDKIYGYLEGDKIQEFQQMIEDEISYYGKGNLLWNCGSIIGGEMDPKRSEEYFNELYGDLLFLFNEERFPYADILELCGEKRCSDENPMLTASHIIIATAFPREVWTEEAKRNLTFLTCMYRMPNLPKMPLINNPNADCASYFIVTMR